MYKLKQKRTYKISRGYIYCILAIALLCAITVALYVLNKRNKDYNSATSQTSNTSKIDLTPATPTEKNETDQNKESLPNGNETNKNNGTDSNNSSNKKVVVPTITNYTANRVNAYISGIFEDNGNCTATFTNNSIKITRSSVGFQNVSYTQCAPIILENNILPKGIWTLTVKYSSAIYEGESETKVLEVN